MSLVDVDDPRTWPTGVRAFVDRYAAAGTAGESAARAYESEPALACELHGHEVLAFHCTRLFDHEAQGIRATGLRPLTPASVHERIAAADARGVLLRTARDYAQTHNVFAINDPLGRADQVCCVLGRGVFDRDPGGVEPFLQFWGGEALRGGPEDPPELAGLGRPSIVVVTVDLSKSGWHTSPPLPMAFAEAVRGGGAQADLFWPGEIPAADIVDIWQPGNPEYDRHDLPRV